MSASPRAWQHIECTARSNLAPGPSPAVRPGRQARLWAEDSPRPPRSPPLRIEPPDERHREHSTKRCRVTLGNNPALSACCPPPSGLWGSCTWEAADNVAKQNDQRYKETAEKADRPPLGSAQHSEAGHTRMHTRYPLNVYDRSVYICRGQESFLSNEGRFTAPGQPPRAQRRAPHSPRLTPERRRAPRRPAGGRAPVRSARRA